MQEDKKPVKVDPKVIEMLDRICEKEPTELTQNDKDILKARWMYVSRDNRAKFGGVMKIKEVEKKVAKTPGMDQKVAMHPADQVEDDGTETEDETEDETEVDETVED